MYEKKKETTFSYVMSVASPNGEWAVEGEVDSTL